MTRDRYEKPQDELLREEAVARDEAHLVDAESEASANPWYAFTDGGDIETL